MFLRHELTILFLDTSLPVVLLLGEHSILLLSEESPVVGVISSRALSPVLIWTGVNVLVEHGVLHLVGLCRRLGVAGVVLGEVGKVAGVVVGVRLGLGLHQLQPRVVVSLARRVQM